MVYGRGAGGNWKDAANGPLLAYLTGVDLRGYDLRYALLGIVAPGRLDSSGSVEFPRADRAIVSLAAEEGWQRKIWVDLYRGFVLREEILLAEGDLLLSRQLHDYRQFADLLYLPGRVEICQGETSFVLEYRRHLINQNIPRARFFQDVPMELSTAHRN
jgi:hypothetical protein